MLPPFLRTSRQIVEERRFLETWAFELEPPITLLSAPAEEINRAELTVSATTQSDRAAQVLDGNPDTRWFAPQDGTSALTVTLRRPADVAGIDLSLAERTINDYPRGLEVDAANSRGVTSVLYRATPYPEWIAGFVANPMYPRLRIALPPNETATLTIRETGVAPGVWWSVHEMVVWRRRPTVSTDRRVSAKERPVTH